ncbi:hypothetical protein CLF_104492 [Clonorchis sinensis]|uniref:Uncharacterized protein n=1 Tax=Clonorchis sinensis TaxID=79923 RepID=G7YNV1_CLOSI|nr:hypothetical protein CLF_104492 [Clonorchis sinensis]
MIIPDIKINASTDFIYRNLGTESVTHRRLSYYLVVRKLLDKNPNATMGMGINRLKNVQTSTVFIDGQLCVEGPSYPAVEDSKSRPTATARRRFIIDEIMRRTLKGLHDPGFKNPLSEKFVHLEYGNHMLRTHKLRIYAAGHTVCEYAFKDSRKNTGSYGILCVSRKFTLTLMEIRLQYRQRTPEIESNQSTLAPYSSSRTWSNHAFQETDRSEVHRVLNHTREDSRIFASMVDMYEISCNHKQVHVNRTFATKWSAHACVEYAAVTLSTKYLRVNTQCWYIVDNGDDNDHKLKLTANTLILSQDHVFYIHDNWCFFEEKHFVGSTLVFVHFESTILPRLQSECNVGCKFIVEKFVQVYRHRESSSNTTMSLERWLCCVDDTIGLDAEQQPGRYSDCCRVTPIYIQEGVTLELIRCWKVVVVSGGGEQSISGILLIDLNVTASVRNGCSTLLAQRTYSECVTLYHTYYSSNPLQIKPSNFVMRECRQQRMNN